MAEVPGTTAQNKAGMRQVNTQKLGLGLKRLGLVKRLVGMAGKAAANVVAIGLLPQQQHSATVFGPPALSLGGNAAWCAGRAT